MVKYSWLIIFELLVSNCIFSFELGRKDSVSISDVPKNEFYIQYYNPFLLTTIKKEGNFNLDFSWNRKQNKYFVLGGRHIHNREKIDTSGLYIGLEYDYLYFTHMHHFSTKFNWLSFEFDYGLMIGRRTITDNFLPNRSIKLTYGSGPIASFEIQFKVSKWGNISIKTEASYLLGQSNTRLFHINSPNISVGEFSEFTQFPLIWILNFGFNFYV